MFHKRHLFIGIILLIVISTSVLAVPNVDRVLARIGVTKGICALLGDEECKLALKLTGKSELLVYVQLLPDQDLDKARRQVDKAGLLNTRIYVEKGPLTRIHLADNIADALVALGKSEKQVSQAEALRVLCPQAKALLGKQEIIKPVPQGLDDWSHPYHGPDNNPMSNDQIIRAPYMTQFLANPQFGPSPQVAVASAGRIFKVYGNVAWHKREEPYLNKLVAYNGYNGTILWMYDLPPGVMVHRSTIVATPEHVYLGDDKSCKVIHAAQGWVTNEIKPPVEVAGGTFWKWMGIEDGVLYALIGKQEYKDDTKKWRRTHHGWPWDKISKGYNQKNHPWGYGKNILAIELKSTKILWSRQLDEDVDARAMCLKNGRIYVFRHGSYMACFDKTNKEIWSRTKEKNPEFFETVGKYKNRQSWQNNWRSTNYIKCSDKALYFAGPQMDKLLAVSTADGNVLWQNKYDNFQLIIRDDAVYGISGPWGHNSSKKFDPMSGDVLAELSVGRRACTRITASPDAIFFRAMGGTIRLDLDSYKPLWISPMRPQCHDGVTIANGMLYWWPWVCDCQLSLYGTIGLGPAGDFDFTPKLNESERLEKFAANITAVKAINVSPGDWPTFRADNKCSAVANVTLAETGDEAWKTERRVKPQHRLTAPTVAGDLVFVGSADGTVRAINIDDGETKWSAYTGGAVRFPPTIYKGRAYVGSGDGYVYTFEAKTGKLLWRFRAAPVERKIPVFDTLLSTWPAASGIIVEDDTAYVAAGIANYDGTYVYALDAITGKVKWQNNTSGHLYPEARTGVSVQGHMLLNDGKLYLAGGNAVSPAVYDITDGKCLNDPKILPLEKCVSACPRGWELYLIGDKVVAAGRPMYVDPQIGTFDKNSITAKMHHASNRRRDITWENNRVIKCFTPIDHNVLNQCVAPLKVEVGHIIPAWGKNKIARKPLWIYNAKDSLAVALCKNALVVAKSGEIVALDIDDGDPIWTRKLPASPVPWGLAVDRRGRVVTTLNDGRIVCIK